MKNPNPDSAKHQEIPVWNAENWFYEDIGIGKRLVAGAMQGRWDFRRTRQSK